MLFAALDVRSGQAIGRHYRRRRRIEFLDFMKQIVVVHPDREISCHSRQSPHPQVQTGSVAGSLQEREIPLHTEAFVVAQANRNLILRPKWQIPEGRLIL
jgi:hypothetical protein